MSSVSEAVGRPARSVSDVVKCDPKLVGIVAAVAVLFDVISNITLLSVAGALFFVMVPALLLWSGRFVSRVSRGALVALPFFGIWLAFRRSPGLLFLDFVAILALLAAAALYSRSGSLLRLTFGTALSKAFRLIGNVFYVPQFLLSAVRLPSSNKVGPAISGVLIALPIVGVLGLLLISADQVFASVFEVDVNLGSLPQHLFVVVFAALFLGTVARAASTRFTESDGRPFALGTVETLVVLGSIVLLFGAFVCTQIVVWVGGADTVLETAGLTYADHARQGFGQLVVVAGLTLVMLSAVRPALARSSGAARMWMLGLSEVLVALTLVIVGVAVSRLFLYESAYGLTVARLYATAIAFGIGAVFVVFGVILPKVTWHAVLFPASLATALLFVFGMNVLNPDALVVNRNLDRVNHSKVALDTYYLSTLSDDGIAALGDRFDRLDSNVQAGVLTSVCTTHTADGSHTGLFMNTAERKREAFVTRNCDKGLVGSRS